ncbi:glycosyl transferase family 90-domain-containing protein [Mycena rosella]|uniref:Glycosyl transferase family 90-domain-containing protein n=1 Tax=Mycena rosella TaxID=1033263 RepID=A0AAD7GI86_MYCRO|nr:glycosyl transferase family 90-domain-containing protein [Mycena rosella]
MHRPIRGYNPARWPWRYWSIVIFIFAGFSLYLRLPVAPDPLPDSYTEDISASEPEPTTDDAAALAQLSLDALLARQSKTLAQAVARYSLKAGRHPPPNFDKWFSFAREHNCLVDEYDQILRDFEPFYQVAVNNPTHFQQMIDRGRAQMLQEAMGLHPKKQEAIGLTTISIIAGQPIMPPYRGTHFSKDELPRTLRKFASVLPDMEFLLNGRDEPRVVFNHKALGARDNAANISDPRPFHITPHHTADFFQNQSGCALLSKEKGFISDESPNIAFLRSSSSSDFTTDFWPLLSMTKLSPCFSDILFPGQYYYRVSRWMLPLPPSDIAWADKSAQLYWRGTSNGGHIIGENYRFFPRFRLIDLARKHPGLINAKMNRFAGGHCTDACDRERIIAEYNITGPRAPRVEVAKFKYLLDVDGNTFSGRFLTLLKSGSLVFKSTVFEEYFNDWIRPYEHYIPVRPDLSDLVEKVEWAMAHDDEARRIQTTGKLFTERVMTDAQNDCYFAAVLLEWARLQSYAGTANVTWPL